MSDSDKGRVVFSWKPGDESAEDQVKVTIAPEEENVPERTQINWTLTATQLLIASWVTRKEQFTRMSCRQVYSLISKDLREMGYTYTGDQCSIKWRSLKATFLKAKASAHVRDKPSTWVHFQAMAEALDEETTSRQNEDEQSSENDQHSNDNSDNENSNLHADNSIYQQSDDSNLLNRTLKSISSKKTPAERSRSEWIKCFNEMKAEWKTRRKERRRMHEERMELGRMKLSLMEELISLLKQK